MLNVGRFRVHRICSRRLAQGEILEAESNYKRSYLWRLRNLACGDSTGGDGWEKLGSSVSRTC